MEGTVCFLVPGPVQPVPMRLVRGDGHGRYGAEVSEGSLRPEAFDVLTDRREKSRRGVSAEAQLSDRARCRNGDKLVELLIEGSYFVGE